MSPCYGNNEIEMPRCPDVTAFECPRCGVRLLNETFSGVVKMKPPTCGSFHSPIEMEQVYLGADAFRSNPPLAA